jgi:hypothetical protein
MKLEGILPIGQRQGDVMIHSLTANIGQFVTALFISFLEGRMFLLWIVTNITFARGTLHCRKTRIPCGDQLVICGLYKPLSVSTDKFHLCRLESDILCTVIELPLHLRKKFPVFVNLHLLELHLPFTSYPALGLSRSKDCLVFVLHQAPQRYPHFLN